MNKKLLCCNWWTAGGADLANQASESSEASLKEILFTFERFIFGYDLSCHAEYSRRS